MVTLTGLTADAAKQFRAEAARHPYLTIADLPSLLEGVADSALDLAYFIGAYTGQIRQTYLWSTRDIEPGTSATDLTRRSDGVANLVEKSADTMKRSVPPVRGARDSANKHLKELRRRRRRRSSGNLTLTRKAATLAYATHALSHHAFGLNVNRRMTIAEHEAVVTNIIAAMETLQVQGGIGGHLPPIIFRAYDGTPLAKFAHLTATPLGTFGNVAKRAIGPLRDLHAELVGTGREIAAAQALARR
jgi:hypothetical protein